MDAIFRSSLTSRGAIPYPGIAWSPDEVHQHSFLDEMGSAPPLPLYTEEAYWTPPRVVTERTEEALDRLEDLSRSFTDLLDRMRPYPRAFEDLDHTIRLAALTMGRRGGVPGGPSEWPARSPREEELRLHRETIFRSPQHRAFSEVGGDGPDALEDDPPVSVDYSAVD